MADEHTLPQDVPPLVQYYCYLTAGCNLACQHCWLSPAYQPDGSTGGHLDFGLFIQALDEGIPLGLQVVKLTGGEPLLHPDFLPMVDALAERQLGLTIETNGTLLTPEIARHLAEKHPRAHISVSLDGAQKETHESFRGVKGSFDSAVAGVKALVSAGYQPQIIMSLHPGNVDEIEALVGLAQTWGAGSVKFNLIQPAGRGEKMKASQRVLDITTLVKLGRWIEGDLQKRVGINLHYGWPMAFFSLGRLLRSGTDACGIFSILGILADGSLAMCGIGMAIPELVYGHLGRDPVAQVWREHPTLQALRRDLPGDLEGICGACLLKWQCLGSCIANNYHLAQRLTAPFWFCQLAEEGHLFPDERKLG